MDPKALLLARLAVARAALWRELVGLDANILNGECICGEWTAADALAHLAAWDEIHAGRVALILDGRPGAIALTEADPVNARIFAERHDWTLERAVREAITARDDFLALIDPLSWDQIVQPHITASRAEYSIRDATERRAFHDALHVDDLRSWRGYAKPDPSPGPKVVLRAALDATREELLAWAALAGEDERSTLPVCGVWSVQDVLGHVADWERYLIDGLDAMADGRVAGAEYEGDDETWNQQHAAARQGEPWATTWADLITTRDELLARLEALSDDQLARQLQTAWSERDHPYAWFRDALDHDREHAESIREALTAR